MWIYCFLNLVNSLMLSQQLELDRFYQYKNVNRCLIWVQRSKNINWQIKNKQQHSTCAYITTFFTICKCFILWNCTRKLYHCATNLEKTEAGRKIHSELTLCLVYFFLSFIVRGGPSCKCITRSEEWLVKFQLENVVAGAGWMQTRIDHSDKNIN